MTMAIRESGSAVRIDVKVAPRSARNQLDGLRDGRLIVRVTASPVDGEANQAVIALLARHLDIPKRDIVIVSGHTSRLKTIAVTGYPIEILRQRLLTAPG